LGRVVQKGVVTTERRPCPRSQLITEKTGFRRKHSLAEGNTPTRVIGLKLGRTLAAVQNKAGELDVVLRLTNQSPYIRRK
jgi:hypothetical protein